MLAQRRKQLIELGKHYGVPIIEDNCYADVHYEGPLEPALYALDDDPNIIYLCSLSKILAPGFRLGYIYSKPPMLERLLARRSDAGSNSLAAAITAEFYKDGKIKSKKIYKSGLIQGQYIEYHKNGQILAFGKYEDSKKIGVWIWYDEDGKVQVEKSFDN